MRPIHARAQLGERHRGVFAQIIGKISTLTILQYINYKNNKPIGMVKHALT